MFQYTRVIHLRSSFSNVSYLFVCLLCFNFQIFDDISKKEHKEIEVVIQIFDNFYEFKVFTTLELIISTKISTNPDLMDPIQFVQLLQTLNQLLGVM